MRSKRLVSLMMALIMVLTLIAPAFVWATEDDGGEEPPRGIHVRCKRERGGGAV